MKIPTIRTVALLAATTFTGAALASSHMDAPLITLDPAANTTDVYAFVADIGGQKNLIAALGVYPHQEPGVGPNKYNFDDRVTYAIQVSTGADVAAGRTTYSYLFNFRTSYQNTSTILQSYLGVVDSVNPIDPDQNLIQGYTVTRVTIATGQRVVLGTGIVPPNNQGNATPLYNVGNDGSNPAKPGVATTGALDPYTAQSITTLSDGTLVFAGQRDDGFYGDINSIFDLLSIRAPGVDSQGGFNIHMMALAIPVSVLGGDQQVVGVHASTFRPTFDIVTNTSSDVDRDRKTSRNGRRTRINVTRTNTTTQTVVPRLVQVARQGNPLFNEALVAIADKDLYSRTSPQTDGQLFAKYASTPELAQLIDAIVFGDAPGGADDGGIQDDRLTNRSDLVGIFIPDVIKCDLSTPPARLAGDGTAFGTNPDSDDNGFSRLGIFGGDGLQSAVQDPFANGGTIPGGWPNGRRFGDDVIDIAVSALASDLRTTPIQVVNAGDGVDGVSANDATYSKVFPYESTPQNGRNHTH